MGRQKSSTVRPEVSRAARPRAQAARGGAGALAVWLCGGLLLLAVIAVYSNSLSGVMVLDDLPTIQENRTIRHLDQLWTVLATPAKGETSSGRPLVNLSLSVNYAIGKDQVRSYHVFNIAVHALATLVLFGLVRRTLLLPAIPEDFRKGALPIALAAALLWGVHPLQTESVTYLVQRAEAMLGLFFLLTLYCVIRGYQSPRRGGWYAAAVGACLMGTLCKEVMIVAPLVVLLFDRVFLAGDFRSALRQRWGLYAGLLATWIPLGLLVGITGSRSGTAGFNQGVTVWDYSRAQFGALLTYLKLSIWPSPLILDYGEKPVVSRLWMLNGVIILALFGLSLVALWRRRLIGLLGVCFFLILAPSSSIVPVKTQYMAEHRMYLPLAAVVCLIVAGAWLGLRRLVRRGSVNEPAAPVVWFGGLGAVALVLGILTLFRNSTYASDEKLWEDNIAKVPLNPRGYHALGTAQIQHGKYEPAIKVLRKGVELDPNGHDLLNNMGIAYVALRRIDDAIAAYREALAIKDNALSHVNIGYCMVAKRQLDEAIREYRRAIELQPDMALAYIVLGDALFLRGEPEAAAKEYQIALKLNPDHVGAKENLGVTYYKLGKVKEALALWEQALPLASDNGELRNRIAWILATSPDPALRNGPRAVELAKRAVELTQQQNLGVLETLSAAFAECGRFDEAIRIAEHCRALAQVRQDSTMAQAMLNRIEMFRQGKPMRDEEARPR